MKETAGADETPMTRGAAFGAEAAAACTNLSQHIKAGKKTSPPENSSQPPQA
jgi:hypothetical protein